MFENPEISPDDLPNANDVEWRALHSRYVRRLQLQAVFTTVAIVGGLLAVDAAFRPKDVIPVGAAFAIAGLILVTGLAWPMVSVPKKGYAIRGRDILYRSGVFWRSVSAVPFNRVQHVETSNTPLDRVFRLATLQLYTAGGSGGDLKIHGMPADVAERMRIFVLEQVGGEAEHD